VEQLYRLLTDTSKKKELYAFSWYVFLRSVSFVCADALSLKLDPRHFLVNMATEEKPSELTLNFFCKTGPQKLSFPAQLTGEELKDQLREPLGVSAETPLALTFQNGSRNSAKKVLEEKQSLIEQGVEDGASVTVKIDAMEVRPENSFLRESIRNNGGNSYYYAHANEKELPPELRYVYGGDPIKLGSNQEGYVLKAPAPKALTHYSWADEGDYVCIYVSAEGEPEAVEAAKDGDVKVQFELRSAELRISKDSKEYALSLRQLEGEIVPEESKHRVSAGKRVTLKMKKKRSVTWTRLQQSK